VRKVGNRADGRSGKAEAKASYRRIGVLDTDALMLELRLRGITVSVRATPGNSTLYSFYPRALSSIRASTSK
jgi:hypothetical protein